MRLSPAFLCVFCLLCLKTPVVVAQSSAGPEPLPDGALRQAYYYQLQPPSKGTPPWHWRQMHGTLPPGIALVRSGTLAGAPIAPGKFHFTLEAMDSSPKPVVHTGEYVITVPSPLTVIWTSPPHLTAEGGIAGQLQVSNGAGRSMDLTVIVVAVNTFNKAFALGYQRFPLDPGAQRISFSSSLPRDTYVVHADAVAEIAETGEIYRTRLQTNPLTIP